MPLGEHSPGGIRNRDAEGPAVLEPERQRLTDEWLEVGCRVHGSLDPVHARNRQAGVFDKALKPGDPVADLGDQPVFRGQVSNPGILFDQPHHAVPIVPQVRQNLHMRLAVLAFVLMGTLALAQEKTVDQGVYTSAQAVRGAKLFESNCTMCHREPGGTAPVLAGERFTKTFSDATLQTVFTTIKTTMPRNAPGSLSDAEYVDLVAHLLKVNNYADGMNELGVADLTGIKIPGQTGNLDFALVQVVGCLAQNGRVWTLSRATEPVRTREPEAPKDDAVAQLDAGALGERTFRLGQVYGPPAGWTSQKVVAKGFLTKAGTEERVNITSMRTLTTNCAN